MSDLLQTLKDTEYQGVKELAEAAERFLREAGPIHRKGTVTEFPNERTVRYYISSGLLTSSTEKRGLRSVFGYEHLLKLLTIKKLQADGLPISVIKDLISDKTVEDLERLFGEDIPVAGESLTFETFMSVSEEAADPMEIDTPLFAAAPPATPQKSKAREYLESLLLKSKAPDEALPDVLFSLAADRRPQTSRKSSEPEPTTAGTWKRYEVVPGLELHARDDFKAPPDRGAIMRIVERILRQFDSK
jgi:DNA-binding transcriptional MerR regulator